MDDWDFSDFFELVSNHIDEHGGINEFGSERLVEEIEREKEFRNLDWEDRVVRIYLTPPFVRDFTVEERFPGRREHLETTGRRKIVFADSICLDREKGKCLESTTRVGFLSCVVVEDTRNDPDPLDTEDPQKDMFLFVKQEPMATRRLNSERLVKIIMEEDPQDVFIYTSRKVTDPKDVHADLTYPGSKVD